MNPKAHFVLLDPETSALVRGIRKFMNTAAPAMQRVQNLAAWRRIREEIASWRQDPIRTTGMVLAAVVLGNVAGRSIRGEGWAFTELCIRMVLILLGLVTASYRGTWAQLKQGSALFRWIS